VGAVIGIAAVNGGKGLRQIRWRQVGGIVAGWAATPVLAGILCVFSLFIMQNVFTQTVFVPTEYELRAAEFERLERVGLPVEELQPLLGKRMASGEVFLYQVQKRVTLEPGQERLVLHTAEIVDLEIASEALAEFDAQYLGSERADALRALTGQRYDRRWKLEDALVEQSTAWHAREATPINQLYNKERAAHLGYVYETFTARPQEESELD
jgi:phosphate/sulfate permease